MLTAADCTALPHIPSIDGHYLLSPDGKELVGFFDAGIHQMRLTRFAVVSGQWEPISGGFQWTGIMRHFYRSYLLSNYRKV